MPPHGRPSMQTRPPGLTRRRQLHRQRRRQPQPPPDALQLHAARRLQLHVVRRARDPAAETPRHGSVDSRNGPQAILRSNGRASSRDALGQCGDVSRSFWMRRSSSSRLACGRAAMRADPPAPDRLLANLGLRVQERPAEDTGVQCQADPRVTLSLAGAANAEAGDAATLRDPPAAA